MLVGVLLGPSCAVALDCFHSIPGELVVLASNQATEEELRQVIRERGLVLDFLESDSLFMWLAPDPALDLEALERDALVRRVRRRADHVSVLFDDRVTNTYAFDRVASVAGARIKTVLPREFRKARVIVPAGEEGRWIEALEAHPIVVDVSRNCASRYRIACERVGGLVRRSGWDDERCELPEPDVAWGQVLADPRGECRRTGGRWRVYQEDCTDECRFAVTRYCRRVVTEACDCGTGRCWYETGTGSAGEGTCIDDPAWHLQADQ